jgi:hypothetical protein
MLLLFELACHGVQYYFRSARVLSVVLLLQLVPNKFQPLDGLDLTSNNLLQQWREVEEILGKGALIPGSQLGGRHHDPDAPFFYRVVLPGEILEPANRLIERIPMYSILTIHMTF